MAFFSDISLIFLKAKSPAQSCRALYLFDAWQFPTLAWGDPTLPSALRRFTSEFGMGSGGTAALVPPGKFVLSIPLNPVISHIVSPYEPISEHSLKISLVSQTKNTFGVVRLSLSGH